MTSQDPPKPITPRLTPLRGPAATATTLIGATCLVGIASAWSDWHRYGVVDDYVAARPGVLVADLNRADSISVTVGVLYLCTLVAAGVAFVVWLSRARSNAELINGAAHRRSRGWLVGGWICPVVNLWFPYQVVDDVWRTSDPGTPADLHSVADLPRTPRVLRWWLVFLSIDLGSVWLYLSGDEDIVRSLRETAVLNTVTTVLLCAAGVFAAQILRQITEWQAIPRAPREEWRRT